VFNDTLLLQLFDGVGTSRRTAITNELRAAACTYPSPPTVGVPTSSRPHLFLPLYTPSLFPPPLLLKHRTPDNEGLFIHRDFANMISLSKEHMLSSQRCLR
jgi:hypothetical protein